MSLMFNNGFIRVVANTFARGANFNSNTGNYPGIWYSYYTFDNDNVLKIKSSAIPTTVSEVDAINVADDTDTLITYSGFRFDQSIDNTTDPLFGAISPLTALPSAVAQQTGTAVWALLYTTRYGAYTTNATGPNRICVPVSDEVTGNGVVVLPTLNIVANTSYTLTDIMLTFFK